MVKYVDSLLNTTYVVFKITDNVTLLEELNSEHNTTVFNYLKTVLDAKMITAISMVFNQDILSEISKAEALYLSNVKYKKYDLELYKNGKLHKTNYEIIPTRNIVFNFNAAGFEVLEKYNDTKNYCFDDLGVEPTGCHYTKDCNVMGEILLSRYDLFKTKNTKKHITTNLNAEELEAHYGGRVRSRLREMFNLISFDSSTTDKRK